MLKLAQFKRHLYTHKQSSYGTNTIKYEEKKTKPWISLRQVQTKERKITKNYLKKKQHICSKCFYVEKNNALNCYKTQKKYFLKQ